MLSPLGLTLRDHPLLRLIRLVESIPIPWELAFWAISQWTSPLLRPHSIISPRGLPKEVTAPKNPPKALEKLLTPVTGGWTTQAQPPDTRMVE